MKNLESFVVFQDVDVMRRYDGELVAPQGSAHLGVAGPVQRLTTTPARDRFLVAPPPATSRGRPHLSGRSLIWGSVANMAAGRPVVCVRLTSSWLRRHLLPVTRITPHVQKSRGSVSN